MVRNTVGMVILTTAVSILAIASLLYAVFHREVVE